MKLFLTDRNLYRVKKGQTLALVAETFGLSPRLLAEENGLSAEISEGQILKIPAPCGNLYTVRGGESKELLCGSAENFRRKNGTKRLYVGQTVLI